MVNLFYYGMMGVVWLSVLLVAYKGLGALFWPLLGFMLAAGAWNGWKQNQPPRA